MAFNRDNRSGGGHFSGRRSFNGDRGGDRQMFKTTCSNCGKECEVPFRPTGSKPVYCSECFRTMGGSDSRRSDDRGSRRSNFDNGGRSSGQPQNREQLEAINAKLDKILKLLNPQKSMEAPDADSQVEEATIITEKAEPVKRKTRSKKPVPTEVETVETAVEPSAVVEPAETETPTKTPTE